MLEFFCPRAHRKPQAPLPTVDPLPGWAEPSATGLRATVLGHSTVLFEIDGVRVLTDPVWSERASPSRRAGPRRFQPVPVALDALPRIDLILLSHDHYDHLDHDAMRRMAAWETPFVTPLGVGAHLESWGIASDRITELDWWERVELSGRDLAVTSTPAQHFSGRGPGTRNHTLWSSWVLESPAHTVFFGADTGLTLEYQAIRERFHPFDLVLLEIGAYHPAWGDIHLGPENALTALGYLGGGPLLPIHWGTFDLGLHRWDQPVETLMRLGAARGTRLIVPRHGEPVEPALVEDVDPWWRAISALHDPVAVEAAAVDQGDEEPLVDPVD